MEDMVVDTDTTTAKRLPKLPPTTYPLSPPSMSPSPLPTPPPSRPALTNPSTYPSLPALISLRNVPSKFPSVVDSEVIVAKCVAGLGAPACQKVELTLPKQVCVELVYGYAHEPAPAPAYPAAPAPHA